MTNSNETVYQEIKNDTRDKKYTDKKQKGIGIQMNKVLATFLGIALTALVIVALLFSFGYGALNDNSNSLQGNIDKNVTNSLDTGKVHSPTH